MESHQRLKQAHRAVELQRVDWASCKKHLEYLWGYPFAVFCVCLDHRST